MGFHYNTECLTSDRPNPTRLSFLDVNTHQDDLRLVRKLLTQQKKAWHEFVQRFQDLVYARVHQTLERARVQYDRSDVEDIFAEVFSSLLANDARSLRNFRGESSLATWLAVVTQRVCNRQIRKLQRQPAQPHDSRPLADLVVEPRAADQLNDLIQKEDVNRLKSKMRKLETNDQEILDLYFFEELGYGEISQRMGISINSVGPKLQRARERLRKLMRFS